MRKIAMIAGLAGAMLACGHDASSPSAPAVEFVDVLPKHTEGGFEDFYSAGDTATIAAHNTSSGDTLPTNVISSAQAAVQRWNNRIFGLSSDSLPHLNPTVVEATSVSGTMIELRYTDECSGTGCGYCGDWYESGAVRGFNLNHKPLGGSCQDGRIVDDLTGVIMHELSHVLGFDHSSGSGTEWCVSNVTEEGDLNPYPCRWEEQAVYAAYDLRDSDPEPGVPIADEIVIPDDPDTVLTGTSSIIRAYGLVGPEPSENVDAAVFYPEDDDYLVEREETVRHYEVVYAEPAVRGRTPPGSWLQRLCVWWASRARGAIPAPRTRAEPT